MKLLSDLTNEQRLLEEIFDENANIPQGGEVSLGQALLDALSTLTPRQVGIMRMRFGLDGERMHTLKEVGIAFDLTRERIRQIEAKSLRQLRLPWRSCLLRPYLGEDKYA